MANWLRLKALKMQILESLQQTKQMLWPSWAQLTAFVCMLIMAPQIVLGYQPHSSLGETAFTLTP